MKSPLDLKLFHLENRIEKYNLQLSEIDSMVKELINGFDLPPTDENVRNLEIETRLHIRKIFNYSNYLAKRIPDFGILPQSMVDILLAPDTTLDSVINYYQSILYLSSVPYEDLDFFPNLNAPSKSDEELKDAIAVGKYLAELDYDNTPVDTLQSQFVEITNNVQSAINTFRICSNFNPPLADKQFVLMTQHLIRLYLSYYFKAFSDGKDNMPEDAKYALKSLNNRLDELDFTNLRNSFEL